MFLGLNNSLSREPSIIRFSNLSTPRKKTSLNAKPKFIIEKHSNTSYTLNPLILSNFWNNAIVMK